MKEVAAMKNKIFVNRDEKKKKTISTFD